MHGVPRGQPGRLSLVEEYALILNKDSDLTSNKRKLVVQRYLRMKARGEL